MGSFSSDRITRKMGTCGKKSRIYLRLLHFTRGAYEKKCRLLYFKRIR